MKEKGEKKIEIKEKHSKGGRRRERERIGRFSVHRKAFL